jgi:predicted O-methyltransferase YrrM
MKTVEEIQSIIGNIPYMTLEQAQMMNDHITQYQLRSVIELGFYHGASTCYIANAISQFEESSIVAIDKERALTLEPNVEGLLEKLDLGEKLQVYYEPNSYLWRLMKMLEENPNPRFDLCYLDGAHNWFVDGFAFFLIDKLLKPGGWIIMDDLEFRYDRSQGLQGTETLKNMPAEERECQQLRKVYELLIKTQPGYGNFREENNWAFAQKLSDGHAGPTQITTELVVKEKHIGLGAALIKLGRRLGMR